MKTEWDIRLAEWFAWSMIVLFVVMIIVGGLFAMCHGAEVSIGYGTQINWNPDWCSEDMYHEVVEVELHTDPNPWTFGIVGQRLQAFVCPGHIVDGEWYEGTSTTSALHLRLGLQGSKGILTGRLFGGFGAHSGRQAEIGDSGVLGHFGAEVGIELGRVSLSYSLTHMSDPLQSHDFGWNYQMLKIGWRF